MYKTQELAFQQEIACYAFSPTEHYLAVACLDNIITLYEKDAHEWSNPKTITPTAREVSARISKLIFSKDEKSLIVHMGNCLVQLSLRGHLGDIKPIYANNNLRDIILTDSDKLIIINEKSWCLLNYQTNSMIPENAIDEGESLKHYAISNNFFLVLTEHNIVLYSIEEDKFKRNILTGGSNVLSCEFSPCEQYLFIVYRTTILLYTISLESLDYFVDVLKPSPKCQNATTFDFGTPPKSMVLLKEKNRSPRFITPTEGINKFLGLHNFSSHRLSNEYIFSPDNTKCLYLKDAQLNNIVFYPNGKFAPDPALQKKLALEISSFENNTINYSPMTNSIVINKSSLLKIISLIKTGKQMVFSPQRIQQEIIGRQILIPTDNKVLLGELSSNGKSVAIIFDLNIQILSFEKSLLTLKFHIDQKAICCTFSSDGQYLAVGFQGMPAKVKIIKVDFTQNEGIQEINLEADPEFLAFSQDSKKIMVKQKNGRFISFSIMAITGKIENGTALTPLPKEPSTLLLVNDTLLKYSKNQLTCINLLRNDSKTYPLIIENAPSQSSTSQRNSLALLPPHLINTQASSRPSSQLMRPISSIPTELACFSPDGAYLAIQRNDRTEIFDVQFQQMVQCISSTYATAYEFSPNNNYLAITSNYSTLLIYDVSLGNRVENMTESGAIVFCKFAPDMKSIFLGVNRVGLVRRELKNYTDSVFKDYLTSLVSPKRYLINYKVFCVDINRTKNDRYCINEGNIDFSFGTIDSNDESRKNERLQITIQSIINTMNSSCLPEEKNDLTSFFIGVLQQSTYISLSTFILDYTLNSHGWYPDNQKLEVKPKFRITKIEMNTFSIYSIIHCELPIQKYLKDASGFMERTGPIINLKYQISYHLTLNFSESNAENFIKLIKKPIINFNNFSLEQCPLSDVLMNDYNIASMSEEHKFLVESQKNELLTPEKMKAYFLQVKNVSAMIANNQLTIEYLKEIEP